MLHRKILLYVFLQWGNSRTLDTQVLWLFAEAAKPTFKVWYRTLSSSYYYYYYIFFWEVWGLTTPRVLKLQAPNSAETWGLTWNFMIYHFRLIRLTVFFYELLIKPKSHWLDIEIDKILLNATPPRALKPRPPNSPERWALMCSFMLYLFRLIRLIVFLLLIVKNYFFP